MREGKVDICITGTDRVLSNGDVINKIGTYLKALAAFDNNIPFYVALPGTTIDYENDKITKNMIEYRSSEELTHINGIDNQGNLRFADNGTNPTAVTNTAFLFNDGGELKVLDELGFTTTISPHNFDLIPGGASEERAWGYYSEKDIVDDEGNVTATQKVNVDMMKLARLVEELTGEKLVYTEED